MHTSPKSIKVPNFFIQPHYRTSDADNSITNAKSRPKGVSFDIPTDNVITDESTNMNKTSVLPKRRPYSFDKILNTSAQDESSFQSKNKKLSIERVLKSSNYYVDCTPHHRFTYSDSFRPLERKRQKLNEKSIKPAFPPKTGNSEPTPKNIITDYDNHLAKKAVLLVEHYENEFKIGYEDTSNFSYKNKIIKNSKHVIPQGAGLSKEKENASYLNKIDRLIKISSPIKLTEIKQRLITQIENRKRSTVKERVSVFNSNNITPFEGSFDNNQREISLEQNHYFRRRKSVLLEKPIARGLNESERIKSIKAGIKAGEEARGPRIRKKGNLDGYFTHDQYLKLIEKYHINVVSTPTPEFKEIVKKRSVSTQKAENRVSKEKIVENLQKGVCDKLIKNCEDYVASAKEDAQIFEGTSNSLLNDIFKIKDNIKDKRYKIKNKDDAEWIKFAKELQSSLGETKTEHFDEPLEKLGKVNNYKKQIIEQMLRELRGKTQREWREGGLETFK